MSFTKTVKAGLDFPHQELSNGGLGIVAPLTVILGIKVSCVSTWGPIKLYVYTI